MSLDEIHDHLLTEVDERIFATGGQIYVSVGGHSLLDLAVGMDGLNRRIEEDTLFAVYCCGKPIVALAIACLIEDRELSLDDTLGDVVEHRLPAGLAPLLVGQLLNHTAGLYAPDPQLYLVSGEPAARDLVTGSLPPPGWRVGHDVGYSQVSSWYLLGLVIDTLTGESPRSFVRRRIIDPAGVGTELFVVGMDQSDYDDNLDRIGINVFLTGTSVDPVLTERTRRFRCRPDPSLGATASARGLGRFYEALLAVLREKQDFVSSSSLGLFTTLHSYGLDPRMGRECGYGYGFMVQLSDHSFGRLCSQSSFGHTAYGGMTACLCDPERDLVVAYHFNGRIDSDSAVVYRRPVLFEMIYRSILDGKP